jgi:hypothetical protein
MVGAIFFRPDSGWLFYFPLESSYGTRNRGSTAGNEAILMVFEGENNIGPHSQKLGTYATVLRHSIELAQC